MNPFIIAIDLTTIVLSLLVFLRARNEDNITWFSLLLYPAYWLGGVAAGHLFIILVVRPTLDAIGVDLTDTTYYLCCGLWGGLLVHLWYKLDDGR